MEKVENINGLSNEELSNEERYLTFILEKELYGLDISNVIEIIGIQEFTKLPETPDYIKGVINLRGQVIPVIDLRNRFKVKEIDYTDRTCIIIINHEEMDIGVVVDEVSEVMQVKDEQIDPPPKTYKGSKGIFLKGIGRLEKRIVMILNIDRLFDKSIA